MEPKQQAPYPLRMPQEMRSHYEDLADASKRSLNAEIVAGLQELQSLRDREESLRAELNHLKTELYKQRLETYKERSKAGGYVIALMGLAQYIPAGSFAARPEIEQVLAKVREDQDAITIQMVESMMQDAKTARDDLNEAVASGRIKVVEDDPEDVGSVEGEAPLPRRKLVGHLGDEGPSLHNKVIVRATPLKQTATSKGPVPSSNLRKPKT